METLLIAQIFFKQKQLFIRKFENGDPKQEIVATTIQKMFEINSSFHVK